MKKPLRFFCYGVAAVFIALIVVVIIAGIFADSALKIAIETAGTKALNVGVDVNEVDLSILSGKLGIRNLAINNPQGYKHQRLLELNRANITINTKSLLSDTVNIKNIKLDGIKITLEQRGISGNNIQDIIKALPAQESKQAEPSGKKLHIDSLEITDAQVNVKLLPVPGKVDTIPLKLGTIKMTNLGSDNDLDTTVLIRIILLAIAGGIARQGADILPEEMLGPLVSELKNIGALPGALIDTGSKILEAGTDIGKGVTGTGKDAGTEVIKGIEDAGKEISEGLKGLLKSKEENKESTK
ncbi:MAG: AsmA family protein [Sedimentisphaerales bacterium]|nr:AsmA family protein [Sedimentisphaerales bacterium]